MEISLYWNCRLFDDTIGIDNCVATYEGGMANLNVREICQLVFKKKYKTYYSRENRQYGSGFQLNQYINFVQAIKSHQGLDFKYIRANFDLGPFDSEDNRADVFETLKLCSDKSADIDVAWNRPTTIEDLIKDSKQYSIKAGKKTPTIFHFNHDHFFVSNKNCLLREISLVEKHFSLSPSVKYHKHYSIIASHYSESLAIFRTQHIYDDNKQSTHLNNLELGIELENLDLRIEKIGTENSMISFIGEFIARAEFLHYFWSHTIIASSYLPNYIARPDWPGLSIPKLTIPFYLTRSELIAHYDGMGRESLLFDINRPLELNFLDSVSCNMEMESPAPIGTKHIINDLLKYFLRTRSVYFEELIQLFLANTLPNPEKVSIYSLIRYNFLPYEALNFLRSDCKAIEIINQISIDFPEINEGIISILLIEQTLLFLPKIYASAVLCKIPNT